MDLMQRLWRTNDVLVMFQGIQTLLVEEYGKPMEAHLSAWILDHPNEFQDCLRRIFTAGCDLAPIGTQASSPFRAKPFGQSVVDRIYELNYESARLAKEVTPKGHYIQAVVSTSNPDFLEPLGNMTNDEVYSGYLQQIKGLIDGKVDLITIAGNHIDEAVIAIKVVKDHCDIPVNVSNSFYAGKKGFRTMMGLDPKAASAKLQEAGAEIIGANCGLMTRSKDSNEWYPAATTLVKEMRRGTDRYLSIGPDAGLAQLINGKTVYPASPEEMAREVSNWVSAGARIVGGDCGSNLEHMRKIATVLQERGLRGQ